MDLSIAILSGGQSRRMGKDKALLDVGGEPLLGRVLRRVAPLSDDLLLIAPARPGYEQFAARRVDDLVPQAGPLGGIYTALTTAQHPYCLVLACDLPFVNVQLLRYMISLPRDYDVLIPALRGTSAQGGEETLQTLHAIYSRACIPAIEQQLAQGRYQVIGFFPRVHVRRIPESTVRQFDPELLSFFNANTPEAYAWALAHVQAFNAAERLQG